MIGSFGDVQVGSFQTPKGMRLVLWLCVGVGVKGYWIRVLIAGWFVSKILGIGCLMIDICG